MEKIIVNVDDLNFEKAFAMCRYFYKPEQQGHTLAEHMTTKRKVRKGISEIMLSKKHDSLTKRSSGAQEIAEALGISARDKGLNQLLSFVKDDSVAISYQSLRQYRNELITMISNILEDLGE